MFICRLFEDSMDELLTGEIPDFSLPIKVTFTGECAQDLGGPAGNFLEQS